MPKLTDALAKKLVNRFGSAQAVLQAPAKSFQQIPWFPRVLLEALHNKNRYLEAAAAELEVMRRHKITAIAFTSPDYPYRLSHCVDGPLVIFVQGNIDFKNPRCISIVGTRRMTTYGQWACREIVEQLAPYNPIIVSGLAFGVDITAHKAAMDLGLQTIACLAHGLDKIMPKTHSGFKIPIQKHGGFVSDFWTNSVFHNKHYLQRNRIIAGLSQATIVVESAAKGGSLVTADIAFSYDRDVFAVPGRTEDPQSLGCNKLIQTNKAQIYTGIEDCIQTLGWEHEKSSVKQRQLRLLVPLTALETTVLDTLPEGDSIAIDTLAIQLNLTTATLASNLLSLELKGLVRPLPGKQFKRV